MVGEACFLRREFDERGNAAFRLGFGDKVDLFVIVDVVIRSARPDGVRGIGVADDGHGVTSYYFEYINYTISHVNETYEIIRLLRKV